MKTNLITRRGFDMLQRELNQLWRVERRETVEKVSWAASLGDRSENADKIKHPLKTTIYNFIYISMSYF